MTEKTAPGDEGYSIENALRSENGVLTMGGARAVVMTEAAYVFLMKVLYEHAPHTIKYAFYDMGYRVGEQLMVSLQKEDEDPEGDFRFLVETYRQSGYGDLEVTYFDLREPQARLSGTDLFEVAVAREASVYRTPRCVCHYSRGMFAGFMSRLLRREVICEEVACRYRGEERCEFVVLSLQWSEDAVPPPAGEAGAPGQQ